MTKIIAWNVNGIRAISKKSNLFELIKKEKPNIICFGETKISCPFIDIKKILKKKIKGYRYRYWSPCLEKKGYSGTAIFSKTKPISVIDGLGNEGRIITLEFKEYYLVHVYTPNSGKNLKRLNYRINEWDKLFRKYIKKLSKHKEIIICGDLNVAHNEIDIANPKTNIKNAGFTIEERDSFDKLLKKCKLTDTYRFLNPTKIEYSFWTYMFNARKKNKGWRIDYFLVTKKLLKKIKKSLILTDIYGSDHAPILLKF